MKKSRRLYLSPINYDEKLVSIQMADEKGELPRDPVEIIGYAPRETANQIREEHKKMLEMSMDY